MKKKQASKGIKLEEGFVFLTNTGDLLIITKISKNGIIYADKINAQNLKTERVKYKYSEDDLLLGKSYIVYGVIDKNQKILNDQTSFYFKKDYANSAVKLMNESVVEKNKPYKVGQFYLMSFN